MARTNAGLIVNRIKCAEVFGVSVDTVTAWVKRGCPFRQKGTKGKEWLFNSADVYRWHLEQVGEPNAVATDAPPPNIEISKARKMAAEAELAEIDRDKARGAVVVLEDVVDAVTEEFATVRTRLGSLPGSLAAELDPLRALEFQPKIAEAVDDILKELSADERLAEGIDDEEADEENGDTLGAEVGAPADTKAGSAP